MILTRQNIAIVLTLLILLPILAGCSSFSEGVTRAILDEKKEDTRECHIKGTEFPGIRESLEAQGHGSRPDRTTKVLMVHGISRHLPGYSTGFRNKLTKELNLTVISEDYKEIKIRHPKFPNDDYIGIIRVTRHLNEARTQEFLFYELTWSHITDPEKSELDFDSSSEYVNKRAVINQTLKGFMNETVPDLLIYGGKNHEKIDVAVGQGICTLFEGGWNDLPNNVSRYCDPSRPGLAQTVLKDDFFYVTHSLGSKIMTDTNQYISDLPHDTLQKMEGVLAAMRQKEIPIFMLANQLPLLHMGEYRPPVNNQINSYCGPQAPKSHERVLAGMDIIAFSDPNDILSYPIPPRFVENNIDSRLCPRVVNIDISIAEVKGAFGIEFANPLAAHTGYFEDDRVIALIADGVSKNYMNPLISQRCDWVETMK